MRTDVSACKDLLSELNTYSDHSLGFTCVIGSAAVQPLSLRDKKDLGCN